MLWTGTRGVSSQQRGSLLSGFLLRVLYLVMKRLLFLYFSGTKRMLPKGSMTREVSSPAQAAAVGQ